MADNTNGVPPQPLDQLSLEDLVRLLGTTAVDRAGAAISVFPSIWDAGTRGIEGLANKFLPAAVSGAMQDARQFVETNPNLHLHRYQDIMPSDAAPTPPPSVSGALQDARQAMPQQSTTPWAGPSPDNLAMLVRFAQLARSPGMQVPPSGPQAPFQLMSQ